MRDIAEAEAAQVAARATWEAALATKEEAEKAFFQAYKAEEAAWEAVKAAWEAVKTAKAAALGMDADEEAKRAGLGCPTQNQNSRSQEDGQIFR